MPYLIQNIGDQGGEGHELNVGLMEDGTIILHSTNPDTGEEQRIVMLAEQWAPLIDMLIKNYGAETCPLNRAYSRCDGEPKRTAA